MGSMKSLKKLAGSLLVVGLLSATLVAETAAATRYDNQIQNTVTHKLASKAQFNEVKSSVEDGERSRRPEPDHRIRAECAGRTTGAETGDQVALCPRRV